MSASIMKAVGVDAELGAVTVDLSMFNAAAGVGRICM